MGERPMYRPPECPHCGEALLDPPGASLQDWASGKAVWLGIGVVAVECGPVAVAWQCPRCGGRWHRWDRTSPYRGPADRLITGSGRDRWLLGPRWLR